MTAGLIDRRPHDILDGNVFLNTKDKWLVLPCNAGLLLCDEFDSISKECLMIKVDCRQRREEYALVWYDICCIQTTPHAHFDDHDIHSDFLEDMKCSER